MNILRLDELFVRQELSTYRRTRRFLQEHTVLVNGTRILEAGTIIDVRKDILLIDGKEYPLQKELYIMMNKKQNTVCTADEGWHERIFESIDEKYLHPKGLNKLHAVGRLDLDTEGLILLTTDGKLSHRLTDPKTHITKTYLVYLRDYCPPEKQKLYTKRFAEGITVEAEKKSPAFTAQPAAIQWYNEENHNEIKKYCTLTSSTACELTFCTLTITEGKFHQVKRMFKAMGNEVIFLKRIAMGPLWLDSSLRPGQYRQLTEKEVENFETSDYK
ncbi:MAG: pseudouridine synthase [Treponema sp.]|nr:pseudouridine synthase [Treponema sp.]